MPGRAGEKLSLDGAITENACQLVAPTWPGETQLFRKSVLEVAPGCGVNEEGLGEHRMVFVSRERKLPFACRGTV